MPGSCDLDNLPPHIESRTRPPERLPPESLVLIWRAVPEEYRHCFLCHALTEEAANDLLEALESRHRNGRRGRRPLPPSGDPALDERRRRNTEAQRRRRAA